MPDIFLSYSRDDQPVARRFAEGFQREGFSVWWDQALHPGEAFDQVTERALEEARAVVVLWSRKSVDSRWVRAEATQANANGRLVPVMIEPCKRPIMFELTHTADLSQWKGNADDAAWKSLVASLSRQPGGPAASGPQAASTIHARRPAWRGLLVGAAAMVLAAALIAGYLHWRPKNADSAGVASTSQGTVATAAEISLAVLPFADLSPASDQAYFTDGLSEEILNQLAQIPKLTVISRTSSFAFKGRNEDMRVIGEKLGARYLLEGSVRRQDNELRITAQLIEAAKGTHLWSRTYAREMKDVFATQEDIARDVAEALSIKLEVGDLKRADGGTTNVEAYEAYLQGMALVNTSNPDSLQKAADDFQKAVTLDPGFSLAWVGLAGALGGVAVMSGKEFPEEAKAAMDQARRLTPGLPQLHEMQGELAIERFDWDTVAAEVDAADAASKGRSTRIQSDLNRGLTLALLGRFRESGESLQRARRRDPLDPVTAAWLATALYINGDREAAMAEADRAAGLPGADAGIRGLRFAFAFWGRDLPQMKRRAPEALARDYTTQHLFSELLPLVDKPVEARKRLRELAPGSKTVVDAQVAAYWAAYLRDYQLVFEMMPRIDAFKIGRGRAVPQLLWSPLLSEIRPSAEFKSLVAKAGLVDHWKKTGKWSDFCEPVGTDDFRCH